MAFKFNLQKVLDVRKHKENLIKNELMVVTSRLVKEQQDKKMLQKEYKVHKHKMNDNIKDINSDELEWYNKYFNRLVFEVQRKDIEIDKRQMDVDEVKKRLVLATQEMKVLERIKERRYAEYLYQVQKEEQDFLDEVGTIKSARKMLDNSKELEMGVSYD